MYASTLAKLDKKPGKVIDFHDFAVTVRDGLYADLIDSMRSLKGDAKQRYKRTYLDALYPGTIFGSVVPQDKYTNCLIENFESQSGLVGLDYDDVEETSQEGDGTWTTAQELRDDYSDLPCCAGAFLSPGGTGVKVFIAVQPSRDYEEYKAIKRGITEHLLRPDLLDMSCITNTLQKCYASHDPECYINRNCVPLQVTPVDTPRAVFRPKPGVNLDRLRETVSVLACYLKVKDYQDYFMLGSACARLGVPELFFNTLENNDWTDYRGRKRSVYSRQEAEKDYKTYRETTEYRESHGLPCAGLTTITKLAAAGGFIPDKRFLAVTGSVFRGL